jgi:acetyltransferase-like isoleucine patch superfamily enzyme
MGRIEEYLRSGVATPFATVHVVHPVYEPILVDARVSFRAGLDAGYYAALLERELQRFLSPWAFEEGQDIVFGARIYRSAVLAFLEDRDYVDFVSDLRLYHGFDGPARGGIGRMFIGRDFVIRPNPRPAVSAMTIGSDFVVGAGVEVAEATKPHAILVSHREHRITPLDVGLGPCSGAGVLGIGYLTVGLDFDVHVE